MKQVGWRTGCLHAIDLCSESNLWKWQFLVIFLQDWLHLLVILLTQWVSYLFNSHTAMSRHLFHFNLFSKVLLIIIENRPIQSMLDFVGLHSAPILGNSYQQKNANGWKTLHIHQRVKWEFFQVFTQSSMRVPTSIIHKHSLQASK